MWYKMVTQVLWEKRVIKGMGSVGWVTIYFFKGWSGKVSRVPKEVGKVSHIDI